MATNQKWALITGASEGIGYELAKLFAKDQYNLVMVALTDALLTSASDALKQEYGIQTLTIQKDLSRPKAPFEVWDQIKAKGISIDVLVNNAAQGLYGEFVETELERELAIIRLNISAYLSFTKLCLKEMVARNEGKILQVSSIGGEIPGPLQAVYHGTKAFITSFTEAIQEETKDTNVSITYLMPGPTDTDFFRKAEMEEAKMVKEGDLDDPAKVAKEGYDALMSGDHSVIPGLKNKAMVASSKIMSDRLSAKAMHKQMEPSKKADQKEKE